MEYITFKAGKDATRQLPDTDQAWNYLHKLSYAARVEVLDVKGSKPFWIEAGETGTDESN